MDQSNKKKPSKTRRLKKWVYGVGDTIIERITLGQFVSDNPFNLSGLPKDIQAEIINLLAVSTTAKSLENVARTINALAQVNKELNTLINDRDFSSQIINSLSQKFGRSPRDVSLMLQTQGARKRLDYGR